MGHVQNKKSRQMAGFLLVVSVGYKWLVVEYTYLSYRRRPVSTVFMLFIVLDIQAQGAARTQWIPACAGMTTVFKFLSFNLCAGMTTFLC